MAEVEGSSPSVPTNIIILIFLFNKKRGSVEVPQISIKDQLKKMVDLQKIDGEIYNLKTQLIEKPVLIEDLKNKFEQNKVQLKALDDKLKTIQLKRKEHELELKSKEDEITKANIQLTQLKTNKEYSAKLSEMEHIKADQSIVEENILLSYDESDSVSKEIEKEKGNVAALEKTFLAKKKEVEEEVKQIEDRVKILETQRTQISPEIDHIILSRYEKILSHKQGIAIVPVTTGNSCGGCFMNVPQQTINAMKMHDQIIACEMCTRILYLEEDL